MRRKIAFYSTGSLFCKNHTTNVRENKIKTSLWQRLSAWLTHCGRAVWLTSLSTTRRWLQILNKSVASNMQSLVNELVKQATDTGMIVNDRKTKEMLIGSILKDPPSSVNLGGTPVERVTIFKLVVIVSLLKPMTDGRFIGRFYRPIDFC